MLQLSGRKKRVHQAATLADLACGEAGVLDHIDLPGHEAQRMMELGFLPGAPICAARCAPGGDPRVYQVDGSEFALRRETAARMRLRPIDPRDMV